MKLLIIGLDGASPELIKKWALEGKLPYFKKLIGNGCFARLESTIHPITGPAWTTFLTGKNPGKHGIYDWSSRKEGSYDIELNYQRKKESYTFFHLLGEKGKRVGLLNVPSTFPPTKINGFIVSGFLTPDTDTEFTFPKPLRKELLEQFPDYFFSPKNKFEPDAKSAKGFLSEVNKMTEQRKQASLYLMDKKNMDVFMVTFMGLDHLQHYFWRFMDEKHPRYDPMLGKEFGDAILKLYQRIDGIVKELHEKAGSTTPLLMMSDHGMGRHEKAVYINNWLHKKGLLVLKKSFGASVKRAMHGIGFTPKNLFSLMLKLGLGRLIAVVPASKRKKMLEKTTLSFGDIDWSKTKAYSFGYFGRIFLNLKGREPQGIVEEKDYDKIRGEVIRELEKFKDPSTNKNVVDRIWKREELFKGPYVNEAADILFSMQDYAFNSSLHFAFGSNKIFDEHIISKSGDHRLHGLFIAAGKGIKKGKEIKAKIVDVAPTALHLLSTAVPSNMDGKVLPIFVNKKAVKKQAAVGVKTNGEIFKDAEKEKIKKRLADLGYL